MKSNKIYEGVEIENTISENAIINGFKIGSASDLQMILTDELGYTYEAEVTLKSGWTAEDLKDIIVTTIEACDSKVKTIKSTFKGVVSQN